MSPYEQSGRDVELQARYRTLDRDIAETTGCAYLDLFTAWAELTGGGWDAADAFGLMHDRFHPSQRGHDDIAAHVELALSVREL